MNRFIPLLIAGLAIPVLLGAPATVNVTVFDQPLHRGRIDAKLFGNFVELLDDVVPGMWAELLNDRSFEGIIPPANWCYYDGRPDICDRAWDTNRTWRIATEGAFNGTRCAELTASAEPASLTQSGLAVKKGLSYLFSGYLRADPGVKAGVLIKLLLPSGEWLVLGAIDLPNLSPEWRRYSVQLPSVGTTDRAGFELRAEGQGHLWADKLSLMPSDNRSGWRPDLVEAVKEVRPAIIRWGGSSIDPGRYRWKDGIGDRDLRVPWLNKNWGRIDSNDVGIDEFCQFCDLTGVAPLVCVSFADGAQSAAELVEYCNGSTNTSWGGRRAANGHPEPYRVRYWQIGNEISGDDPAYLDQLPGFIQGMKRADATMAIMTSFPSAALLKRVGKDAAYICPHHYTPDLAACDRDFKQIAALIDTTPGCAHLKMGVTEWNIDAGSWGLGRAKQATLEAALMNARYLHLLMRHSDRVEIACRSNLANSYCGAIIETAPAGIGVLKRASYHVMQLYARHALPVPLRLEAGSDVLDLFACSDEGKTSMVLFAVNPRRESVDLRATVNGFARPLHVNEIQTVSDTHQAGQPDVVNHWDAPDRIRIAAQAVHGETISVPGLSVAAVRWTAAE